MISDFIANFIFIGGIALIFWVVYRDFLKSQAYMEYGWVKDTFGPMSEEEAKEFAAKLLSMGVDVYEGQRLLLSILGTVAEAKVADRSIETNRDELKLAFRQLMQSGKFHRAMPEDQFYGLIVLNVLANKRKKKK
jgi:hypothetical protein